VDSTVEAQKRDAHPRRLPEGGKEPENAEE
jgi:hypothetical protein